MGKLNSKYFVIGISSLLVIVALGMTYAYWRGAIQGEGAKMTVNIDQVSIIFTDDTSISDVDVKPGWSTSKTFIIENQGMVVFTYDIYIEDLINTLVTDGYLQYKISSSDGGYNMSDYLPIDKSAVASDFDLVDHISINPGVIQTYTIEFRYVNDPDVDQSEDMGKIFGGHLMIRENTNLFAKGTLGYKILEDHSDVRTRVSGDFDSILGDSTATTGVIYKESTYKEDGNDVYYFAGNVADNWVEFAGKMWRIIRTNEDGGVRLLYHGTSTTATDAYIATSTAYNSIRDNTMYVGYMYGSTGSIANNRSNTTSSPIKTVVDNWYRDNINASYNGYVSETAIYCNDRASGAYASSGYMYYAAISRLGKKWQSMSGNQPSYQCGQNSGGGYFASGSSISSSIWTNSTAAYTSAAPSNADKFSKSTASGGNGKLTYPVGLMTADEVAYAGGIFPQNSPNTYYYLNSAGGSSTGSNWWWTMSPSSASGNSGAIVFFVYGSTYPGSLNSTGVVGADAVRPVLSLKSCVTVSEGNGTASSPYKVELPSTCATAEN